MLPEFANFREVWIEITGADQDHGGTGWEFGTCLWSPTTDVNGGNRYEAMWEPLDEDLVLHFYRYPWDDGSPHTEFCGYSIVKTACRIVNTPPPVPGRWVAPAYYRIDLHGYKALPARLKLQRLNDQPEYLARIRAELFPKRPKRYPFAPYGELIRTTQGQYLTHCTANLYEVLRDALGYGGALSLAIRRTQPQSLDYREGKRKLRETYFFTRNPQLAADAKHLRNYTCEVCAFNFVTHYGELGKEFAECHHKNPLSERPEEMWTHEATTSIEDVAVVCANCHRMLHRRRPALKIEELIKIRQTMLVAE